MQHLTDQSKVWLTAKPNLRLIKGISFILSFSTRKKKIPVIAETLFQQHCNYCSDCRETSFRCDQTNISSHQNQIYCTTNGNNL